MTYTVLVPDNVHPSALDVLNASSGRSFVSESLVADRVLTGRWPRTFRLALLDKDVGIATVFLKEAGVDGRVLDLTRRLFAEARAELGEAADHVEAIRLIGQATPARMPCRQMRYIRAALS